MSGENMCSFQRACACVCTFKHTLVHTNAHRSAFTLSIGWGKFNSVLQKILIKSYLLFISFVCSSCFVSPLLRMSLRFRMLKNQVTHSRIRTHTALIYILCRTSYLYTCNPKSNYVSIQITKSYCFSYVCRFRYFFHQAY
jgi:hypothetical protein